MSSTTVAATTATSVPTITATGVEDVSDSTSTFLELGWTSPHIQLGSGYDFGHRQLRESAIGNIANVKLDQPGIPHQDTNIKTVTTSEELQSRINSDIKATIPLGGVNISLENSYLSEVAISKTSLTQITQETYDGPPSRVDYHQLQLTEEALKILNGPDGWKSFSARYGEYFIYGYVPRAKFSAITTIKTSSESTREEIKTSLAIDAGKSGDLKATLEAMKASKQASVSIDIKVEITGGKKTAEPSTLDVDKRQTNDVEKVQKWYEEWAEHHEAQPFTGLLCHYSVFDTTGKIPLPGKQFAYLGREIEKLYKSLYTAQIELAPSTMVQAAATAKKIAKACGEIKDLDTTDTKAIEELKAKAAAIISDAELWGLREQFLHAIYKAKDYSVHKSDWTESGNTRDWTSGLLGAEGKFWPLRNDVSWDHDPWRTQYSTNNYLYHTSRLGTSSKMIMGLRISSYWNDNTNGWLKFTDGNVGDTTISVELCTYKSRGADWDVEVWMLDKDLYETK